MKSNKQFINEIYEKYDEYTKEKQEDKQRNMRKIINMAAVVLVLISSLIVFSEKKVPNKVQVQNVDKFMEDNANLETVGSFENFYQIIKEKSPSNVDKGLLYLAESITEDISKNSFAEATTSQTNTQVQMLMNQML